MVFAVFWVYILQRPRISVVRVFEDETFILSKILFRNEMFNLVINPALRLYNVVHSFLFKWCEAGDSNPQNPLS